MAELFVVLLKGLIGQSARHHSVSLIPLYTDVHLRIVFVLNSILVVVAINHSVRFFSE